MLVTLVVSKGRLAQYLFEYMFVFLNTYGIIPSLTAKEAESPENTGFQPLFTHQKCSYILLLFSFLTGFLDA